MKKSIQKVYWNLKFKKRGIEISPFQILKQLEISQFSERDLISKYQLERINDLIDETKKNVPFYKKNKFKDYSNFCDMNDFKNYFPIITKDIIKGNYQNLKNYRIKNTVSHSTSGSTGKPLKVAISGIAESYRIANRIRLLNWWGCDFFDKYVYLWNINSKKNIYSFLKKIEDIFLGVLKLNVFDLNDDTIHKYVDKIDLFRPKYIRGYKSGIYELARLMQKNNLKFNKAKLKFVIVTSETLFDYERTFIEEILRCKVVNEYGSADGGQFANECPEGSMHINEESIYISSDKNDNALVTELYNYSMPLINYQNEDKIFFSNNLCSCGRGLKLISKIEGRTTEYIECEDGVRKPSVALGVIFTKVSNKFDRSIIQFNALQNKRTLHLEIIPDKNYNNEVTYFIQSMIKKDICKNLDIEIKLVDQLIREKSGKLKYFKRIL